MVALTGQRWASGDAALDSAARARDCTRSPAKVVILANTTSLTIRPIDSKADRKKFVDLPFRLYKDDPNRVPPLKGEALGLLTPAKNGWFSHAKAQLFLAERGGRVVGRSSAHIDTLALELPAEQGFGPGCGQFGLFDAED